jgi:hypothetical protein
MLRPGDQMSHYDIDDEIDFDFFEESDAEVDDRRRSRPPSRGGPRRPVRGPSGLAPLARLIGLIAFAILIVVLLVFWAQSCAGASKRSSYRNYMNRVSSLAAQSDQVGKQLNDLLTTPGLTETSLESKLSDLTAAQQALVGQAAGIHAPGPLRAEQQHVVDTMKLRVAGLSGLLSAFQGSAKSSDATAAGAQLALMASRLVASDVVWDDLVKTPTIEELKRQGIGGVAVPDSSFISNPDFTSTASLASVWRRIHGSTASGAAGGLHGTGIVSVVAQPGNQTLSTSSENTVRATTELAFDVTVKDTGDNQEVKIPVTLTIQQSPTPITQTKTIDLINAGEEKTVTFDHLGQVEFATKTTVKVDVQPVPQEKNLSNNSADYPVIFSLG